MKRFSVIRSFVIPILEIANHSEYNIYTLLGDLDKIDGEVICIFNSLAVFEALKDHPRITRYAFNSQNVGVSRSWNMGLDMAEGETVFVLNDDLHLKSRKVILEMEAYLKNLDKAVIVGPEGTVLDFEKLTILDKYLPGQFASPVRTHDVSGYFFAIQHARFLDNQLRYDARYTPCFFEEWDMGKQILEKKLAVYTVPVTDFDHKWGTSLKNENTTINFMGKSETIKNIMTANKMRFLEKWGY